MSAFEGEIDTAYWNEQDCQLNSQHAHTPAVYTQNHLLRYYQYYGITSNSIKTLSGLKRYIVENDCKPITSTLQGAAYSAIDITTGRKVILKCSSKKLVKSHRCINGKGTSEDIRNEANLLHYITDRSNQYTDSCMYKSVCQLIFINYLFANLYPVGNELI